MTDEPDPEPGPPSDPVAEEHPAEAADTAPLVEEAPAGASLWARYVARRRRKKAAKAAKPHRKAPWWELPALVVLAILIAILVKTFIVQPFYIPSASMEDTLHGSAQLGHDRILVNKLIYDFRDPHPGDIVVFHAPPGWDDEPTSKPPSNPVLRVIRGFGQLVGVVPPDGEILVKRVIATGGQTVKGNAAGQVMISTHGPNGPYRTLNEPYVHRDNPDDHDNGYAQFGPVTIPHGRLWVMGDHRDDSADSRFHCSPSGTTGYGVQGCEQYVNEATVPIGDVIGKAFVVAWPPSHWRTLGTPPTFEHAAAAAGPALPGVASLAVVVPVFALRRRRRRR